MVHGVQSLKVNNGHYNIISMVKVPRNFYFIVFSSRVSILLLTRNIDIVILSVRPSVCLSVTRWYCMKMA